MENEKNVKKENNNKISILIWNFQQAEHFGEFTRLSPVIYGVVSGDPPHPAAWTTSLLGAEAIKSVWLGKCEIEWTAREPYAPGSLLEGPRRASSSP